MKLENAIAKAGALRSKAQQNRARIHPRHLPKTQQKSSKSIRGQGTSLSVASTVRWAPLAVTTPPPCSTTEQFITSSTMKVYSHLRRMCYPHMHTSKKGTRSKVPLLVLPYWRYCTQSLCQSIHTQGGPKSVQASIMSVQLVRCSRAA